MILQEEAVGRVLAIGVLNGHWQVEHFDEPTKSWLMNEADRRSAVSGASRRGHCGPFPPAVPYRNLAREWIDTHKAEWDELLLQGLNAEPAPPSVAADFMLPVPEAA